MSAWFIYSLMDLESYYISTGEDIQTVHMVVISVRCLVQFGYVDTMKPYTPSNNG